MGSSISRAVNSQMFRDDNDAQLRKPAMSIFGQGFKNKKKSFDVADDLGKANRTLRFQSEAGHNEMIGRQRTNQDIPAPDAAQESQQPASRIYNLTSRTTRPRATFSRQREFPAAATAKQTQHESAARRRCFWSSATEATSRSWAEENSTQF